MLDVEDVPENWLSSTIIHLGPVAAEIATLRREGFQLLEVRPLGNRQIVAIYRKGPLARIFGC